MTDIGIQVFRPETKNHDTLLNVETTNHSLSKDITNTIATRCEDNGTVTVWLGKDQIRALQYSSDYPKLEPMKTIDFLPTESIMNENVGEIMALLYMAKNQTLWGIDFSGTLLTILQNIAASPESINLNCCFWSLAHSPDEDTIWIGADNRLIRVKNELKPMPETILMKTEDGQPFNNRAFTLAVDDRWVWFGDPCVQEEESCIPLGIYNYQHTMPVKIDPYKHVYAITVDGYGAVWIGTEKGLLFYPSSI